ncbi:hypothetical protein CPC08DRAFT_759196 [Agrocybe pediades]|nr:hypothetical protein CPC08DRAFT_759196 [Agrocybe pediades]
MALGNLIPCIIYPKSYSFSSPLLLFPDPSLPASQSDTSLSRPDHPQSPPTSTPVLGNSPSSHPPITQSSTSPTVRTPQAQSFCMESVAATQDDNLNQPPAPALQERSDSTSEEQQPSPSPEATHAGADPQLIEGLKSKDRLFILKVAEMLEALIKERRIRVELQPATSYQRLLVHRCSAYYKLTPESDPLTKALFVNLTAEGVIPDRRISELVPAEEATQPSFQIMRRTVQDRRLKPQSQGGSVAGEDADLSDVEPSEAGSLGGRSSNSASAKKHRLTIEERAAAYNAARSRIFMDFEEKKEKDLSASSSSLSLAGSGSTSAGGRSNISDTDDAVSSPATESEWSVPSASHSRDRKENRRGGHPNGSASSNRSLRSGGSFHGNNSGGSSRNSRAPSPSFSYASLHDASPAGQIYDAQHPGMYYPGHYAYPYSPPAQGPGPYMNPYPYYPAPYALYTPPANPQDPSATAAPESFPAQQMNYAPHYGWVPPTSAPVQSPPHNMQMPLSPPHAPPPPQGQQPLMSPPMHGTPPAYPPYAAPHAYAYPVNPYYPAHQMPPPPPPQAPSLQNHPTPPPPQPNMQHAQSHPHPHQQPGNYEVPRNLNANGAGNANNQGNQPFYNHGNGPRAGLGNGIIAPNNQIGRSQNRNNTLGHVNGLQGTKNNQMPPTGRSAWSYGPGVGNGGLGAQPINDAMGPRFQSPRHVSGNSSTSSVNNSRSSTCDDATSTSSSTTSSSSRRTYTSTTSSQQHPLPPRPDWAVGLRAQPTLAPGRHLDHSRNISPNSPSRGSSNGNNSPLPMNNGNSSRNGAQHAPSVSLQSNDFPPLTSVAGGPVQEKRTPIVAGAWGQSRPALSPSMNANANGSSPGSAQQSPTAKQDEGSSVKSGEVTNPKLIRRPGPGQGHQRGPSKDAAGGLNKPDGVNAALGGPMSALNIKAETLPAGNGVDPTALSAALNDAAATASSVQGAKPVTVTTPAASV